MAQALACVRRDVIAPLSMAIESKEGTPQSFEPVDPWASEDLVFKRRNLPHLSVPGATYFVTFRSRILLPPNARDLLIAPLRDFTERHIDLDAAVVMPDHVHLVFRLLPNDPSVGSFIWLKEDRRGKSISSSAEKVHSG